MGNIFSKKYLLFGLVGVLVIVLVFWKIYENSLGKVVVVQKIETPEKASVVHTVIGKSVQGRDIDAYSYGTGKTHLLFVGGVHGGYEWNSVVLAYKFLDYFDVKPESIPSNITVTIVPNANPDGVFLLVGKEGKITEADIPEGVSTIPGRFNANKVDLNRNFDCKWQPKSTWQGKVVSAGTKAFSEPESEAIRNLVEKDSPVAVIFWHSQSGAVYASQCKNGILPDTLKIMNAYAAASGYKAVPVFSAYETTGDSEAWLASIGIPSITVEMTTHETIEWEKNIAGVKSLLNYFK